MSLQKETKSRKQANPPVPEAKGRTGHHGRWYDDACGTAFAMEVVGERWTMLIIRELMLGARRFSQLRASLPGISAKVLTERLESLDRIGVLRKRALPAPASVQVYELTEWGYHAEPMMQELGRWAARSPLHDPMLPLSAVSLMMSLRTMFDADKAGDLRADIAITIGGEHFLAALADGVLTASRLDEPGGGAVLTVPQAPVLAALFYGKVPMEALESDGALSVEGDRALAQRFIDIFELPPKCES